MKHLVFSIVIVVSAAVTLAAEAQKPKLTRAQIEERKYRHFGGHIYQPMQTKVVSIANEQKMLDAAVLEKIAAEMQDLVKFPVRVGAKDDVAVTLKVCECDVQGPLVVYPDNALACVSVKKLSADNPSKETLELRVTKELWRALIYVLGGGNTFVPQCVMKQVASLKDLDAIPARCASPDAFSRINDSAEKLGIKRERRVTYRQACKEGWAPAPTNDVQRAVAERVKTEMAFEKQTKDPTKPIRIKFNDAKK